MILHYLDSEREPRECPCDCHESPETDDPDCPTCHGAGRLGEEGAEPDVETRYYDDGFTGNGLVRRGAQRRAMDWTALHRSRRPRRSAQGKGGELVMRVTLNGSTCTVERTSDDPTFRRSGRADAESTFLYHVKRALNAQGFDFIKKRMAKDGHMMDDRQQYLRERNVKAPRVLAIYSPFYAIEDAGERFNRDGKVTLRVDNLVR